MSAGAASFEHAEGILERAEGTLERAEGTLERAEGTLNARVAGFERWRSQL